MNVNDTLRAILSGKFDGDKGGRQAERRRLAREDMRFALGAVQSATLRQSLTNIGNAGADMVLTEEDIIVVDTIRDGLVRLLASLPDTGSILAIRGNQSHRWDR